MSDILNPLFGIGYDNGKQNAGVMTQEYQKEKAQTNTNAENKALSEYEKYLASPKNAKVKEVDTSKDPTWAEVLSKGEAAARALYGSDAVDRAKGIAAASKALNPLGVLTQKTPTSNTEIMTPEQREANKIGNVQANASATIRDFKDAELASRAMANNNSQIGGLTGASTLGFDVPEEDLTATDSGGGPNGGVLKDGTPEAPSLKDMMQSASGGGESKDKINDFLARLGEIVSHTMAGYSKGRWGTDLRSSFMDRQDREKAEKAQAQELEKLGKAQSFQEMLQQRQLEAQQRENALNREAQAGLNSQDIAARLRIAGLQDAEKRRAQINPTLAAWFPTLNGVR